MDEFLIVLAVAIVIIVVLALFSFSPALQPSPKLPTNVTIESFSLGIVGFTKSAPIESINIGPFTAGTTQAESLKRVAHEEISAGWLGGNSGDYKIVVDKDPLTSLEKIIVDFDVNNTNQYGNLVVSWNDEILFNEIAKKEHHKLEISKDKVNDKNSLKIYTGASWRFWASTIYVLNNLDVRGEFGKARVTTFSLSQDDFDRFDRGEISFSILPGVRDSNAKLIIKVNGNEVYNKNPTGRGEQINFTHQNVNINVPNNLISFRAEGGLFELNNVKVDIYTLSSNLVKKRSFRLTNSQLASLEKKPGTINIVVDKILKPSKLKIEINGKSLYIIPVVGLNNVTLEKSQVVSGDNQIEFSAIGTFEISKVDIVL